MPPVQFLYAQTYETLMKTRVGRRIPYRWDIANKIMRYSIKTIHNIFVPVCTKHRIYFIRINIGFTGCY